jgi:hypothetical protein|uniref:Uncharacterized protein n=1 Tax=viral metagenome TaxID=1070528 RepID=A0A6C0BNX6_9ZZZZ
MVDETKTIVFNDLCNTISHIKKPIYFTFEENEFVQSYQYNKPVNAFQQLNQLRHELFDPRNKSRNVSPIPSPKRPSPKKTETVVLKSIASVFLKIIEPLGNIKDNAEDLMKLIDKYQHLLKTITSKHKQLHKQISDYVNSSNVDLKDMSHLNKNYMMFWSKIMNMNIYIVNKSNLYHLYESNEDESSYMVIKFDDENGYELLTTNNESSFDEFNSFHKYRRSVDVTKLSTKNINELRNICIEHEIEIGSLKCKKADIINMISNKMK